MSKNKTPFFVLFSISLIAVLIFSSCEKVCDSVLIMHHILIVDQEDNPISGIDLEIINVRTGKPLCSQIGDEIRKQTCMDLLGESPNSPEYYVIISTSNVSGSINGGDVRNRDVIEVRGKANGVAFASQFIVHTDKCNIVDVKGTERIVVAIQAVD